MTSFHCLLHSVTEKKKNIKRTERYAELSLPQPVPLCGDIKIEFFHSTKMGKKVIVTEKLFLFNDIV